MESLFKWLSTDEHLCFFFPFQIMLKYPCIYFLVHTQPATKSVGHTSRIGKAKAMCILNSKRHCLVSFQEVALIYSE